MEAKGTRKDDRNASQRYSCSIQLGNQGEDNYYSVANNVAYECSCFGHIMEYSICMTLGQKLNKPVNQIKTKYQKGGQFSIPYIPI